MATAEERLIVATSHALEQHGARPFVSGANSVEREVLRALAGALCSPWRERLEHTFDPPRDAPSDAPSAVLTEPALRAAAFAQDLRLDALERPARAAGHAFALHRLALRLGATRDDALTHALDAALPSTEAVDDAARAAEALFEALARSLDDASGAGPYAVGALLNADAGAHAITDDPRELDAALRAGERSWEAHPYYALRYGARGRRFTRSDSAWLVTLARAPAAIADGQLGWLSRVLAARGMPGVLLEAHLALLHDELTRALPERAAEYAWLALASRQLADRRRAFVSDARLAELSRRFDAAVGEALARRLPGVGALLGAAVADERAGVAQAVASLTSWLTDPERFPPAWVDAVRNTLAAARAVSPSSTTPRA